MRHLRQDVDRYGGELVTVDVQEDGGVYTVTSPQMPEIFLVHEDLAFIESELPAVIKSIAMERYQLRADEVIVVATSERLSRRVDHPWAVVPVHVIEQMRERVHG